MKESREAASLKRRISWQSSCLLVFSAGTLCATVMAAQAGEARPGGHEATQQESSNRVSAAACAKCHQEIVKNFDNNPHSRPSPAHRGRGVTCESCHGPDKAHAEGGAVSLIFDPARAAAKDVDESCQECHEARRAHFEHSVHGNANLSCIDCHVIHGAGASRYLLKTEQPELCIQCHSDVKQQFSTPFHHKVQEGLINCTDCHDPHGALGENSLPSATWQFMVCTKCHGSIAGPFVHEHAAVKAEGCTACHFPHGGPNPKMLIQASVNTICQQCHLPSPNSTAGLPLPAHIHSAHSPSCVSCHASIHGSNISAVFLKPTRGNSEH
ncbi:MAG: DmsE family decaheme c-type cytochrome [Terracidiphilus sp.]